MINAKTIQPNIAPNSTLIVGFSGGPDSVYLLTMLYELAPKLNLKIIAAHLDHQWRKESHEDALWCKKFCDDRNIACIIQTPTELDFDIKFNGSQEEFGRKLRRAFFEKLAAQFQANHIVLAHHNDDQLETFFIRLARGSSLTGLVGMKQKDGLYLRPMLQICKKEILDYLEHYNIEFLTDATNSDPKYLRNRIRHQLMPQLHSIDARFLQNLANCMTHLQKTDQLLEQMTMQTVQSIMHQGKIQISSFLALHVVLQHRILMHLFIENKICLTPSTALFEEITRFLQATKNINHQIHPKYSIIKEVDHFYFKSL